MGLHILFLSMEAEWMNKNGSYRFRTGPVTLALSYKRPQKLVNVPKKSPEDVREVSVPRRKEEKEKQPKPKPPKINKKSIQKQTPKPPRRPKSIPISPKPQPANKEGMSRPKITPEPVSHPVTEPLPDFKPLDLDRVELNLPSEPAEGLYQETALPDEPDRSSEPSIQDIREATPVYRENPRPRYPRIARRRGYQGTVILEVLVNQKGRVGKMGIFRSSGYSVLDKAAMTSVRTWVFEPGMRGDKKVEMWVKVPIRFQLE